MVGGPKNAKKCPGGGRGWSKKDKIVVIECPLRHWAYGLRKLLDSKYYEQ